MHKRILACLLCFAMALLLLAGCGEEEPEPETNADGMTRPVTLADGLVPTYDANGEMVTNADGSPVMIEKPKTAPDDGPAPLAGNDWAQTAAPNDLRPFDLYSPGDPALNSPVKVAGEVQVGRVAWPLERLPAALPVAAQYIDRLDGRGAGAIVYVTEMPYEVFLAYAQKLREAGLEVEFEFLPDVIQPLKRHSLTGKLGEWDVIASWVTEKYPGFIANFELLIEGASS